MFVLLGFSFLEAKPFEKKEVAKKEVAKKEFVFFDISEITPKFYHEDVAQPRKFCKILSSKISTWHLQKVKATNITYKHFAAQTNKNDKPKIRFL
jgi:hypothetical protein